MKTARDVINLSLKKIGVLRSGGEASASDAADALASLVSLYEEWISQGAFGRVRDVVVNIAGEATAYPSVHVNETVGGVTIELPQTVPYDYWYTWRPYRDYGWGLNVPLGGDDGYNVPRDKSVIRITSSENTTRATYIYDGTIQRWMRLDTLGLSDEAPLSARGFDGLASVLAVRMTELFGSELAGPQTMRSANRYNLALVTNYGTEECDGGYWQSV